uniref:Uncharacterized protein n=1 Tax=Myoviridae sp. ctsmU9 TaxID=2826706 RepID=A0A8S5MM47_9CAUD|nr:MAG TPA: hypothetical protein [Myoviridae sp. ctsmU9]DAJ55722.1 MAG TPA: hypothetical protein [Caudoviricetes sp.]
MFNPKGGEASEKPQSNSISTLFSATFPPLLITETLWIPYSMITPI